MCMNRFNYVSKGKSQSDVIPTNDILIAILNHLTDTKGLVTLQRLILCSKSSLSPLLHVALSLTRSHCEVLVSPIKYFPLVPVILQNSHSCFSVGSLNKLITQRGS